MTAGPSAGARMLAGRLAAAYPAAEAPRVLHSATEGAGVTHPATEARVRAAVSPDLPLPDYVVHDLARWRLLQDVGFRYLVPDPRLLPEESIRFFTLDAAWLDAFASGALAAGASGSRERAQMARTVPLALAEAHQQLPLVRATTQRRLVVGTADFASAAADAAAPALVTGFILRSAAVSGFPGIQVRAWTSDSVADIPLGVDPAELATARPDLVVPVLRLEQLAPSVLFALFSGEPRLVWLEEPHHGVQLGLEEAGAGWTVPIRSGTGRETGASVPVPLRTGPVPGVVDVAALRAALDAADGLPAARGSAAVALALLQPPSRQRFAASAPTPPDSSTRLSRAARQGRRGLQ